MSAKIEVDVPENRRNARESHAVDTTENAPVSDDRTRAGSRMLGDGGGTVAVSEAGSEAGARDTAIDTAAAPGGVFGPPLLPDRSDRLTLIDGIDAAAAALLGRHHVTRFTDIAAFTSEDVDVMGELLGDSKRIARQRWIEQATLLARGIDTPFSAFKMGSISLYEEKSSAMPEQTATVVDLAAARARRPLARGLRNGSASLAASAFGGALAASIATLLVLGHGVGDLVRSDLDLVERIKAPIIWMTTPRTLPLSGAALHGGAASSGAPRSAIARTASLASAEN
jgi:predicted flap endonuclease-1-like 5' DNA nuclease